MKSFSRIVLVVAMVGGLLSAAVGAGAQEAAPSAYLANVNGSSSTPVDVAVGGEAVATGLEFAAASPVPYIPAGPADVTFTEDGAVVANVSVNGADIPAQTVVTGYGTGGGSAYPVEVEPIEPGVAKLVVWNATNDQVVVSVGTLLVDFPLEPGQRTDLLRIPVGGSVPVQFAGAEEVDVSMTADSYTDVFAVNDGATLAAAVSIIPSMAALIDAIGVPGPSTVPVPDVAGLSAADGQTALEAAGLVATPEEQETADVEAGLVIGTDPAAGTEVQLGSTVTMMVSAAPATVPVPDVAGRAAADAQAALEAAGFVVTSTEQASGDVEAGFVISTNPSAGIEVAPGTTVDMAVSTGPEAVEVPEFIGMTTDEAMALAEEFGLTITFVEDATRPNPNGVVVDQMPEPGEMVEPGSEITAQLSPLADAPYVVINVDTNRMMTTTGLNFLPGSTTTLSVVGTDLRATVPVDDGGVWWETFQLGEDQARYETLLVEGTTASGTPFRATFEIPPAGGSNDEATESTEADETEGGFPWWGWVLIALAVVGIGVLVWWLVAGRDSGTVTTTNGGGGQTPPSSQAPPASGGQAGDHLR